MFTCTLTSFSVAQMPLHAPIAAGATAIPGWTFFTEKQVHSFFLNLSCCSEDE
jgi:hypothetical protein